MRQIPSATRASQVNSSPITTVTHRWYRHLSSRSEPLRPWLSCTRRGIRHDIPVVDPWEAYRPPAKGRKIEHQTSTSTSTFNGTQVKSSQVKSTSITLYECAREAVPSTAKRQRCGASRGSTSSPRASPVHSTQHTLPRANHS